LATVIGTSQYLLLRKHIPLWCLLWLQGPTMKPFPCL
jgi:hypothetical protein